MEELLVSFMIGSGMWRENKELTQKIGLLLAQKSEYKELHSKTYFLLLIRGTILRIQEDNLLKKLKNFLQGKLNVKRLTQEEKEFLLSKLGKLKRTADKELFEAFVNSSGRDNFNEVRELFLKDDLSNYRYGESTKSFLSVIVSEYDIPRCSKLGLATQFENMTQVNFFLQRNRALNLEQLDVELR